jgi:hypothetical protein
VVTGGTVDVVVGGVVEVDVVVSNGSGSVVVGIGSGSVVVVVVVSGTVEVVTGGT